MKFKNEYEKNLAEISRKLRARVREKEFLVERIDDLDLFIKKHSQSSVFDDRQNAMIAMGTKELNEKLLSWLTV